MGLRSPGPAPLAPRRRWLPWGCFARLMWGCHFGNCHVGSRCGLFWRRESMPQSRIVMDLMQAGFSAQRTVEQGAVVDRRHVGDSQQHGLCSGLCGGRRPRPVPGIPHSKALLNITM